MQTSTTGWQGQRQISSVSLVSTVERNGGRVPRRGDGLMLQPGKARTSETVYRCREKHHEDVNMPLVRGVGHSCV